MSTNFLNRRMDLLHSAAINTNFLTMDTSYPVKIAGKILKLFTAADIFNTNDWVLQNTESESILTISSNHVYDFAGRVIKNNIGEEKAYATNADVYKLNDYVMVIIDFDDEHSNANPSIHLCSQTNFANFITGGSGSGNDCKFKLFDITGDTPMGNGFDYNIDTDVFESAIEFDNLEDSHALIRHSSDNIVYELPVKDNNNNYSMKPVSNLETIDINSINMSIQNFIYPSINIQSVNVTGGFDTQDGLELYKVYNGSFSDKFIEEYCFTEEEMLNLGLWNADYVNYIKSYYNNISGDKSEYYYVLKSSSREYDSDELDSELKFTPIKISNNKIMTIDYITNNAFTVGDKKVEVTYIGESSKYFGNFWGNDLTTGYSYFWYNGDYGKLSIYNLTYINDNGKSVDIDSYDVNYTDYINNGGNIDNADRIFHKNYNLTGAEDSEAYVNRFIDFFCNDDSSYKSFLLGRAYGLSNGTSGDNAITFKSEASNSKVISNTVIMYPELYENVLFDKDGDTFTHSSEKIRNFTSLYNGESTTDFDRTDYYNESRISARSNINNYYTVYELFDHANTIENAVPQDLTNGDTYNYETVIKGTEYKYKYRCNKALNSDYGKILVITNNDNVTKKILLSIVNKLIVSRIAAPYYTDTKPSYNNAEIGHSSVVVRQDINSATDSIEADGNNIVINFNGISYQLYKIVKDGTNLTHTAVTTSNFKTDSSTETSNLEYYYFITDEYVYRIKYFWKSSDTSKAVNAYDYYTISRLFKYTEDITEANCHNNTFTKAYVAAYVNTESATVNSAVSSFNSLRSSSQLSIVEYIVKAFNFYPVSPSNDEFITNLHFTSSVDEFNVCTTDLILDDFYLVYPRNVGDITKNDGTGLRKTDFYGDYVVYQNGQIPSLSNVSKNGSLIYSIQNYNKFIQKELVSDRINTVEFKYINGIGIREDYYVNKSLYDFYNSAVSRNLAIPKDDTNSIRKFNESPFSFFKKSDVANITNTENINGKIKFKSGTSNYTLKSSLYVSTDIDSSNIYNFNKSTIYSKEEDPNSSEVRYVDATKDYSSNDNIFVNVSKAGDKIIYSIAISDANITSPSIVPLSGMMDDIDDDKIKWDSLLIALFNDKSIDLLSSPLRQIKSSLNTDLVDTGQNINDSVDINDDVSTLANSHDNIFDVDSKYYKEHNAEFDSKHNVYKFNYGYGFINQRRDVNNRGVIVFVSDGSYTSQIRNGAEEPPEDYRYQFTEGNIYPKRMYINNDGLLCTKEYFDNEAAEYTPAGGTGPVYPDNPTTIAALLKKIEELENRITTLEGN